MLPSLANCSTMMCRHAHKHRRPDQNNSPRPIGNKLFAARTVPGFFLFRSFGCLLLLRCFLCRNTSCLCIRELTVRFYFNFGELEPEWMLDPTQTFMDPVKDFVLFLVLLTALHFVSLFLWPACACVVCMVCEYIRGDLVFPTFCQTRSKLAL